MFEITYEITKYVQGKFLQFKFGITALKERKEEEEENIFVRVKKSEAFA